MTDTDTFETFNSPGYRVTQERWISADGARAQIEIDARKHVLVSVATLRELLTDTGWSREG
jgi:hypothetical protein